MVVRRNKAFVVIYTGIIMIALMALVSFAVDWGRVQMAKTQLQNAVDAASRYAVTGLRDNTFVAKAQAAALQNSVDGSTLSLSSADIEVGAWDTTTRVFTLNGAAHNAVRVTGRRTTARGNPVPLLFARVIGRQTCDVTAVAVASQDVLPYSVVALNGITMTGNSTIKRIASESASGSVIVASNGAWSLTGSSSIAGDVLYRTTAPTGTISGTKTAMTSNVAYGAVTTPGGAFNAGAVNYTSGTFPVSGDYSVSACTVSGTFAISLMADTNMYCTGNCSFGGNAQVITNGYKFTIFMIGSGTISFTNSLPVSVVIYGPSCNMTVNAPGAITGSFVVNQLNMTSNSTIQYTSTKPIPLAPTGGNSAAATSAVSTRK